MFAGIQGSICRTEVLGELRLTETVYLPGSRLPEHQHECGCFGFVLQGELCEQFGSLALPYKERTVFFRPAEVAHRDRVESQGARCFHVEMPARWIDHVNELSPRLKQPTVLDGAGMRRLAQSVYLEWRELDDVGPLVIEGLICEMAAHLCRSLASKKTGGPPAWLKNVQQAIEAQYREPLSLRMLADAVAVHPVHVARQFRRYTGMSVGQFIRSRRVEFARQELSLTDKPLVEIAFDAGFAQQAHFTTVFKRVTGTTPLEYRTITRSRSR